MFRQRSSIAFYANFGLVLLVILTRTLTASRFLNKWDSVQFALALSDYDIARHQPHPPGYPGYIALARLIKPLVSDDNMALVLVGIIAALVLVLTIYHLGTALLGTRGGLIAGLLAAINPLLWYFSSIALAYMSGTALATLAAWAAFSARGKVRWLAPIFAGLASIFWLPAGILVFPVCLWGFLRTVNVDENKDENEDENEDEEKDLQIPLRLAGFLGCFIVPLIVGYLPAILDTGGPGPFLAEIVSESTKHGHELGEWIRGPIDEFLATTGSLAAFFEQGLGMGKWLLLVLLVPIIGESGCNPKRVIGLLPLGIAGFAALYWGNHPLLRTAGIAAFFFSLIYLLPKPIEKSGWDRLIHIALWLIPGLLLFVLVYVNYVGIFIFFLPPLILLEAWMIERAASFVALQTIRDNVKETESENNSDDSTEMESDEKKENEEPAKGKGPDSKVEKFVLFVLVLLMVMNDVGGFIDSKSQESWTGILARDVYIDSVISAVEEAPVPQSDLIVLGGAGHLGSPGNYRHWQYYIPEARTIWIKYLLNYPVREDILVWVSKNRHHDKVHPDEIYPVEIDDVDKNVLAASFELEGAKGIIAFPDDMKYFSGSANLIPLFVEGEEDIDPVCFMLDSEDYTKIVFLGGRWHEWVDDSGELQGEWTGDWVGRWWLE